MDIVGPQQILTLAGFMALLGVAWLVVQLNRGRLPGRTSDGRRLIVCEAASIGTGERAVLIEADGQPLLAVIPRRGPAQIVVLPAKPEVPA